MINKQGKTEEEKIIEMIEKENDILFEDLPDIDLYMDQLIGLFEVKLAGNKEKVLTKTMINNYSRDKLLGAVNKKKYSKNQILRMLIIYNLKQTMSITEMQDLFSYIKKSNVTFEKIYEEIIRFKKMRSKILSSVMKNIKAEQNTEINSVLFYSILSSSFKKLASMKLEGLEELKN